MMVITLVTSGNGLKVLQFDGQANGFPMMESHCEAEQPLCKIQCVLLKMYFKVSFGKGIVELQHACAAATLFVHVYLVSFKLSGLKRELTLSQNHILIVLPIELFTHIYLL